MSYGDERAPGAVPDGDAEWVAVGQRRLWIRLLTTVVLVLAEVALIRGLVTGDGMVGGADHGIGLFFLWCATIVLGIPALLVPLALLASLRGRKDRLGVDAHGVWTTLRGAAVLFPWDDLCGVRTCVLEHPGGKGGPLYSHHLELLPHRPADPADARLWWYVRRLEPAQYGLPETYWQFRLPSLPSKNPGPPSAGSAPGRLAAAVQRRRPDLWLGVQQRRARGTGDGGPLRRPDPQGR